MNTNRIYALIFAAAALTACGETSGSEGTVDVTVYGEDFIEKGIPAEEMTDGWAITFDTFVVTVDEVVVGGVDIPSADPIDISVETDGSGHAFGSAAVPTGAHTGSSYAIARVELAGSATKEGVTKNFSWVFDEEVHYSECETTTTVSEGDPATFQITVHADHYFYDSLVSSDPSLVFQELADADTDGDDEITRAELEAADIGSLDPGSDDEVDDLWSWLVAQNATLGHVDGEGHCDAHSHSD
jgi:hypothetical protein